ncbi:MAG: hypothetical protein OXM61_06990, partial [Candidatus Poribacteria bacterium]|nr:hypothetical protein [Candidatus Poribacteria bacterium]
MLPTINKKFTPKPIFYQAKNVPKALATLHSADDLDFTVLAKFRLLPLRFRDNFPIHSDGDTGLGGIQLQGDEQVVDIYIKANLFGFTVN